MDKLFFTCSSVKAVLKSDDIYLKCFKVPFSFYFKASSPDSSDSEFKFSPNFFIHL